MLSAASIRQSITPLLGQTFADRCLFRAGRAPRRFDRDDRGDSLRGFVQANQCQYDRINGPPSTDDVSGRAVAAMVESSEPEAEEAVRDRLSFRRFCGIPLDAEMPDHSSTWRFRQTVERLGLSEQLLAEVNRQLAARRGSRRASNPRRCDDHRSQCEAPLCRGAGRSARSRGRLHLGPTRPLSRQATSSKQRWEAQSSCARADRGQCHPKRASSVRRAAEPEYL